jgi:5-formyltetrahydrofolate cyclo-ligase
VRRPTLVRQGGYVWARTPLPMTTSLSRVGDDQANAKQVLRSRMRGARSAMSQDAAAHAARMAASHLLGIPELDGVNVAGLYAAFDGEIDTREAADGLQSRGVMVAYPRISPGERVLRFHLVRRPDDLEIGPFGIPQPAAHAEAVDLGRIPILIVPGLAFDEHGGRVGWGKGYYDATLAQGGPFCVGYAYAFQLVSEVPRRSHDVSMDLVVTDAGVIRASERAKGRGSAPRTLGDEPGADKPAS